MTLRQFSGLIDEIERTAKFEQGENKDQALEGPAAASFFRKLALKNKGKK